MMKMIVVIVSFLLSVVTAQPPIWAIVGGEVGIGSCYDIVTESITFPAYKFTFEDQNTVDIRGQEYLLPDTSFGYSSPEFINDSRITIMDSFQSYYSEYISSWGVSVGAQIKGVDLKAAFSHTKGQINALVNDSLNSFAENTLTWTEFQVNLWPGLQTLNDMFKAEVERLPQQYNEAAYMNFINEFGTHVIVKCAYGAAINFTAVFHSDLVIRESENWVKNQISLSIGYMQNNVGINWSGFNNHTRINDTFILNSNNQTTIQGGQTDVLQSQGFAAWFQTVTQDYSPIFAQVTVEPLSTIIQELDPIIAANLEKAIIIYGNTDPSPERLKAKKAKLHSKF